MARFAKVEAGRVVSIGERADTEQVMVDQSGAPLVDENNNELRERVAMIPFGCVAVSDGEYAALRNETPDLILVAEIVARAAL